MRAVVDAKEFSQALDKVSKVPRKSAYVPALGEVLAHFSDGRCILTGTDFDTWLTTEIPARGDDFSFVFHRTANVAKVCRHFDGELAFDLTESGEGSSRKLRLCMSCGCREGEFHALFPEEYPPMPALESMYSFTVNAARLLERVNRIKYATLKTASGADTRTTSVQFSGDRIFCLDGLRAAWSTDETVYAPKPFLVAAAPLEHMKFFGGQEVSIGLDQRYVDITDGISHLVLRRVEAVLYDLDSAIPEHFREEISFCPDEFLTELTCLKELIPNARKPYIRFCGGNLLMQTDTCRYQTRIQMDGHSEIAIGFNISYLMDTLRQFKGEPCVRMRLASPISPVILEAEGRSDHALLLPVRLKVPMAAAA